METDVCKVNLTMVCFNLFEVRCNFVLKAVIFKYSLLSEFPFKILEKLLAFGIFFLTIAIS